MTPLRHAVRDLSLLLLLAALAAPVAAQDGDPGSVLDAAATEATAAAEAPFTRERFEELQEQDALILVDVFAEWCPVCASQQKLLAEFRVLHPEVELHVLKVDFDRQKEWVRHFRAPRQSTLILYRGDEQVWFSVAENRREVIFREILEAAGAG